MIKNILARIITFMAVVLTERDKRSRPIPHGGRFYTQEESYATKARLYYGDDQY